MCLNEYKERLKYMVQKEPPIWFKILSHFEKKGYIQNGVTIPFLIGSNTVLNPSGKALTITQLVNEFQIIHDPEKITIQKCGNIGEYVIGILDNETKMIIAKYKQNVYKNFKNFVIIDSSFDSYQDINQILKTLEDIYLKLLSEQKYSKNDGVWTGFTEIDKKRLNEVK